MRSRSSSSRVLFLAILGAIAVVYGIGRLWMRPEVPAATEAGLVPGTVSEATPGQ